MRKLLSKLVELGWHQESYGDEYLFKIIENEYNIELPVDYKKFMLLSNGGEGDFKPFYLSLWKLEHIVQLNLDYKINYYLNNDIIGVGTDGGDECWAFDYANSRTNPKIVKISLGNLELESVLKISNSFTEFIKKITG